MDLTTGLPTKPWAPSDIAVSGVSPSLLVSEIEVEKKGKSQHRLPLLPPPLHDPEGKEGQ